MSHLLSSDLRNRHIQVSYVWRPSYFTTTHKGIIEVCLPDHQRTPARYLRKGLVLPNSQTPTCDAVHSLVLYFTREFPIPLTLESWNEKDLTTARQRCSSKVLVKCKWQSSSKKYQMLVHQKRASSRQIESEDRERSTCLTTTVPACFVPSFQTLVVVVVCVSLKVTLVSKFTPAGLGCPFPFCLRQMSNVLSPRPRLTPPGFVSGHSQKTLIPSTFKSAIIVYRIAALSALPLSLSLHSTIH